jgi:hypothetical protein
LQALTALNDEAYFEAARALAARALKEAPRVASAPSQSASIATYAFRLIATRTPRPDEVERIVSSYAQQLERFRKDAGAATRVVKGYAVADVDAVEQAAWTLVANALLNLDEAMTKE